MTAPALDKILTALQAALATALPTTLVEIDRPSDEEHGNAELPAVNIVHQGTEMQYQPFAERQNATEHVASIDLDMLVKAQSGSTNAYRLRIFEADLVAALSANWTLGGLVQPMDWTSSSGMEDVEADVAGRTLTIKITFSTPLGDHRSILGAAGIVP